MGDASFEGPLDEKTQRLIKLGIAIGAMRGGAVLWEKLRAHGLN